MCNIDWFLTYDNSLTMSTSDHIYLLKVSGDPHECTGFYADCKDITSFMKCGGSAKSLRIFPYNPQGYCTF